MDIAFLDRATVSKNLSLSAFHEFGSLKIYNTISREELFTELRHVDIIITNKVKLDREILSALPELKLICLTATGTNNIDLIAARDLKIAVCNVAGYSTECVAQHTFALLFYVLEHLPKYDQYVKSGQYSYHAVFTNLEYRFWEIAGKHWGIIGMGAIGRRVAEIAQAFSCVVSYYSTSNTIREESYPQISLDALLEQSDIISIHAPLNAQTKNLITAKEFSRMKPTSIILNLGRGSIINEADLAHALESNTISAAGLDVLEHEPIQKDNPLLATGLQDKIIITPHIAWGSMEAQERLFREIHANIAAFLAGDIRNRVEL